MSKQILWSRRQKDFEISWFSGTGAGGQHRNKHMNACRMKDKETNIQTESQKFKSAIQNRKAAFHKMINLLKSHYKIEDQKRKKTASFGHLRIRTYNQHDDRVVDEQTGNQYSFKKTVGRGDISKIIDDRIRNISIQTQTEKDI